MARRRDVRPASRLFVALAAARSAQVQERLPEADVDDAVEDHVTSHVESLRQKVDMCKNWRTFVHVRLLCWVHI